MFGMSSIDFWENEPQLYWAYRFSYIKKLEEEQKIEVEKMRQSAWLNGMTTCVAAQIALNNCFSKKTKEYPSYDKMFENNEENNEILNELKEQLKGIEDEDVRQQIEFNYWARL